MFCALVLCNKRVTWIETAQDLLNPPPQPISSPEKSLLFTISTVSRLRSRGPLGAGESGVDPRPSPRHPLPPPALEVTGHISSSSTRESALTLQVFPECPGRGWEFWGGEKRVNDNNNNTQTQNST